MYKGSKIVLGGHLVQVRRFEHEINDEKLGITRTSLKTRVAIYDKNEELLSENTVSLHHNDQPDDKLGRHHAFKGAMANLNTSKEVKRAIWSDYSKKLNTPVSGLIES